MDGLAPGLKSIRPGSFPEAPIGYIKNANEVAPCFIFILTACHGTLKILKTGEVGALQRCSPAESIVLHGTNLVWRSIGLHRAESLSVALV